VPHHSEVVEQLVEDHILNELDFGDIIDLCEGKLKLWSPPGYDSKSEMSGLSLEARQNNCNFVMEAHLLTEWKPAIPLIDWPAVTRDVSDELREIIEARAGEYETEAVLIPGPDPRQIGLFAGAPTAEEILATWQHFVEQEAPLSPVLWLKNAKPGERSHKTIDKIKKELHDLGFDTRNYLGVLLVENGWSGIVNRFPQQPIEAEPSQTEDELRHEYGDLIDQAPIVVPLVDSSPYGDDWANLLLGD
jgi:hypothetical protein